MEKVNNVYEAWKADVLDKFLAGEDGSDHSSPAILNVPTPVDWVSIARSVWSTYSNIDISEKHLFVSGYEDALEKLINGSSYEIWASAYLLGMQISGQEGYRKNATFSIRLNVNDLFWDRVQERKTELDKYHPLGNDEASAYAIIMRLDKILLHNYGASYSSVYHKK